MRNLNHKTSPFQREEKKKVYILLTRFRSNWSKTIGILTRERYTHVSLGFEEDIHTFYSFVFKGFLVENIDQYITKFAEPIECVLYELEVPQSRYEKLKKEVEHYVHNKHHFRYNRLGLLLCLMRIPWKRRTHYFCSQFVAELLQKQKILPKKKSSALYLPKDFRIWGDLQMNYQGDLEGMLCYHMA